MNVPLHWLKKNNYLRSSFNAWLSRNTGSSEETHNKLTKPLIKFTCWIVYQAMRCCCFVMNISRLVEIWIKRVKVLDIFKRQQHGSLQLFKASQRKNSTWNRNRNKLAIKVIKSYDNTVACRRTCFFLRQGILWVQIRAVLGIYSSLVLLSSTSNAVQTHTYGNTNINK